MFSAEMFLVFPPVPIDLSYNTNLTTLTVNCSFVAGENLRFRHRWILSALESISGNNMRRLTIALSHPAQYDESNLETLTWTDLDRALAQVASSQKNMESITFSMRARQNTNEWAERAAPAVLSRLPVSQANRVPIKVRCYEVGKDGRWPMYPVE